MLILAKTDKKPFAIKLGKGFFFVDNSIFGCALIFTF